MGIVPDTDAEPQTKYVQVWVPFLNADTINLSPRARMVLPRLAVVSQKHPITAVGLRETFAAFLSRDAIGRALKELERHKLAKKTAKGWVAVEPQGSVREAFRWKTKKTPGPWFRQYVYTTIPIPTASPWPGRSNALELFAVWRGMIELKRQERPIKNRRLSLMLGLHRETIRQARKTLAQLLKDPPKIQYLTYEVKEAEQPGSLAAKLRELNVAQPEAVIAVAKLKGFTGPIFSSWWASWPNGTRARSTGPM